MIIHGDHGGLIIHLRPCGPGRKAYVFQYDGSAWVFTGWQPQLLTDVTLDKGQCVIYARKRGDAIKKAAHLAVPNSFIAHCEGTLVGTGYRRTKAPRPKKQSRVRAHQRYKEGQRKARKSGEAWSGRGQGREHWVDGEQCLR